MAALCDVTIPSVLSGLAQGPYRSKVIMNKAVSIIPEDSTRE